MSHVAASRAVPQDLPLNLAVSFIFPHDPFQGPLYLGMFQKSSIVQGSILPKLPYRVNLSPIKFCFCFCVLVKMDTSSLAYVFGQTQAPEKPKQP